MIINPYTFVVAGVAVTFDPLKKGTAAVLSGGDNTLTTTGVNTAQALATTGYTTGSYYWEVVCNAVGGPRSVGISRAAGTADYETDLGQEAGEYGWYSSGASYFAGAFGGVGGAGFGAGDVVGVAVNFGTRRMWVHVNGTYITGNPSTNTSPIVTYASGLGTIYAAASVTTPPDSLTLRTSAGSFGYPIPSGFSAYG